LENQTDSLEEVDRKARDFGDTALAFRIMLKFAESERVIQNLTDPVTLTLINPVYKETGRLQTREEHPHGENSLRMKILTLQYFEGLNPNFKGRVFVVDDGCPDGSGKIAEKIVAEYPKSAHRVLFLGKGIDSVANPIQRWNSTFKKRPNTIGLNVSGPFFPKINNKAQNSGFDQWATAGRTRLRRL
jgi:hypothetical protein